MIGQYCKTVFLSLSHRHVYVVNHCNIARYGTCLFDRIIRSVRPEKLNHFCEASLHSERVMSNIHKLSESDQSGDTVKLSSVPKNSIQPVRLNGFINTDLSRGDATARSLLDQAVRCLQGGGVIAVPTDTIYGICCLAQNVDAVNRIYDIKGRSLEKPLAISVADIPNVYRWGKVVQPDQLLADLLPGPVTIVLERTPQLNPALNPGNRLVGIRVPDSGFIREVCRAFDEPLALTSANISNQQSSLCVQEFAEMWDKLDAVFDGGWIESASKSGSTVVDLSVPGQYTIIRNGSARESTLEKLKRHGLQETIST